MMAGRRAHPDSKIVISEDISNRALCLVANVAKTDVFEFIKLFELSSYFDEAYYVDTIN